MKVTNVEKKEKSTVELVIEVGAEEFEAAVQQAYLKNRASISVPGFRKGKAPRKIVESMYGTGVFYEDAIEAVYPGAYAQAVAEQLRAQIKGYLDQASKAQAEVSELKREVFRLQQRLDKK